MSYSPDPLSLPLLGTIIDKLTDAKAVAGSFQRPPRFFARLPGGELYLDSTLELDTDGWQGHGAGDPTWQSHTSLRYQDGSSDRCQPRPLLRAAAARQLAQAVRHSAGRLRCGALQNLGSRSPSSPISETIPAKDRSSCSAAWARSASSRTAR